MHAPPHLDFQLVSPEKAVFSAPVSMVVIPAARGAMGILPHHAPMILNLQSGVVEIYEGENMTEKIFVAGGFAEITPQGCNVATEDALFIKDINPEELEAYIKATMADIEATPAIDEKELLQQNLIIARAKIEIFARLGRGGM